MFIHIHPDCLYSYIYTAPFSLLEAADGSHRAPAGLAHALTVPAFSREVQGVTLQRSCWGRSRTWGASPAAGPAGTRPTPCHRCWPCTSGVLHRSTSSWRVQTSKVLAVEQRCYTWPQIKTHLAKAVTSNCHFVDKCIAKYICFECRPIFIYSNCTWHGSYITSWEFSRRQYLHKLQSNFIILLLHTDHCICTYIDIIFVLTWKHVQTCSHKITAGGLNHKGVNRKTFSWIKMRCESWMCLPDNGFIGLGESDLSDRLQVPSAPQPESARRGILKAHS